MALTKAQQWALVLAPKMTGVCSIVFSSLVIYTVLICPDKRSKTYHRLVLGISCVDISSSFWLAMSTWPIPKEEEEEEEEETNNNNNNTLWAVGTTTTCTIQGFFTQFGIASSFYNASLSIFYLLVIRYGWKDDRIRRLEPLFHCLPISWGLITAIVGLPLTLFNNATLWCWIASYQDRGESAELYRWLFFYGPLWFMILVVTMNVVLIFQHVHKLERVTQRHSFTPQATTVLSARRITVDYERSNELENNGGTVVVLQQEEVARHDDDDEQMEEDDNDDDNEQDLDDDSLDDETKEEEQQQQTNNNNYHHHSKEFTTDSGLGGNVPITSAVITNGLAQDEDDAAAADAAVVTTPAVVASSNIPKGLLFRLSRNNWTNSVALSSLCTGGTSRTHVIQSQQQQQPTRRRKRRRRSQKVANQSLRYAGSLYFTWTALTVRVCVCVSLSLWWGGLMVGVMGTDDDDD